MGPRGEYAGVAMAAYAVIARIGRVDPHLTLDDLERDLDADDVPAEPPSECRASRPSTFGASNPGGSQSV